MPKPHPKPRRLLPYLLLIPLLTLLTLPLLPLHPASPPTNPSPKRTSTPPLPPDHCILQGANPREPSLWGPGSRALCLVPDLCLPTHIHPHLYRLANRPTTCNVLTPDFQPPSHPLQPHLLREFGSCHAFQHRVVSCAYGMHYRLNRAVCPVEHIVWPASHGVQAHVSNFSVDAAPVGEVRWVEEEVVVLLPEYPYQRNIFHFSNVVPWMAAVIDAVDVLLAEWQRAADAEGGGVGVGVWSGGERKLRVLIRGRLDGNVWQRGLWDAVWGGWVTRGGWRVNVTWLGEEEAGGVVCGRRVVMMGMYADINAWPFVNGTEVREGGWEVPVAAVKLKEAVYRETGVAGVWEREGVMRSVPLVVGYAKRMGREALREEGGGSLSGNVKEGSTDRVFTPEDEVWFEGMLKEEVEGRGVELREFMTLPSETFGQQVRRMAGIGLVVGIHGANLVNGMWVRPWGGLVEVFPYGAWSRCYWGGMNSGLAYWSWEAGESYGGFRCDARLLDCRLDYRNRNVYLGKEGDREGIRNMVAEAVEWLKKVHGAGSGIRVKRHGDVYVRQR